jgi:hypothetical protein
MIGKMKPGSILVADKYHPSFFTICALQRQGVDMVSIAHHNRIVDFTTGTSLGQRDHIAEWRKPTCPPWMAQEEYDGLPDTLFVREFIIDIDGREGGKEQAVVISTMTDPTIPQKELSDLYWRRWNCELDLRAIKQSMHLDVLRCKTPDMVKKEIYAHLLAYNLLRGVMVESAKRKDIQPRQLSVKGAMQAVESFTPAMMSISESEVLYDAFMTTVSAHRVGNRPGRQEPRVVKRRHSWRQMMVKPRNQYHRKLAAGRAAS